MPGNAQVIDIKMFSLHLLFSYLFTSMLRGYLGGRMSQQSQSMGTVAFVDINPFFFLLDWVVWTRSIQYWCWVSGGGECAEHLVQVTAKQRCSMCIPPLPFLSNRCLCVDLCLLLRHGLCTASTKLCNYTGSSHSKGEEEKREGREQLPSLLTWSLFFFPTIDDNLHESPFRTFITGDFIA